MKCEICNDKDAKFLVLVEGAELSLCEGCKKFGRVIKELKEKILLQQAPQKKNIVLAKPIKSLELEDENLEIVADFAKRIRQAREGLGITQKEFAMQIAEKESIVHKLETGNLKPDIMLARKLEKLLKIKLLEKREG